MTDAGIAPIAVRTRGRPTFHSSEGRAMVVKSSRDNLAVADALKGTVIVYSDSGFVKLLPNLRDADTGDRPCKRSIMLG